MTQQSESASWKGGIDNAGDKSLEAAFSQADKHNIFGMGAEGMVGVGSLMGLGSMAALTAKSTAAKSPEGTSMQTAPVPGIKSSSGMPSQAKPLTASQEKPHINEALAQESLRKTNQSNKGSNPGEALYAYAKSHVGMRTNSLPGTEHGALTDGGNRACAATVNYLAEKSGIGKIGGGLSTTSMFNVLKHGKGTLVPMDQAQPGDIIISPSQGSKTGHVGIVGEGGKVYSNSSSKDRLSQNYTTTSWKNSFNRRGLKTYVYRLNPPQQNDMDSPTTKLARLGKDIQQKRGGEAVVAWSEKNRGHTNSGAQKRNAVGGIA